jgi:hypothetical protein
MKRLSYTLLSDGSTDRALLPILKWSLRANHVTCAVQPAWADLRRLPRPPLQLAARLVQAVALYPCDLLFVHRDAERATLEDRIDEIRVAFREASLQGQMPRHICVVPVRMQEAWLLFDEAAIRWAAGNPNGKQILQLPALAQLEQLPDPKEMLYDLLREASGLEGRRRRRLELSASAVRVSDFVEDYAPLRTLPAFQALQLGVQEAVQSERW